MNFKLIAFMLLLVACATDAGDSTATQPPSIPPASKPTATHASTSANAESITLASGQFDLPAAFSFGEAGFHEAYSFTHALPADLPSTTGQRLVITLRDLSQPDQTCTSEHPLSGCATIDWSDSESRPNVPPGGVFDNSIMLQFASGPHTFYLSESGTLADAPDRFDPG